MGINLADGYLYAVQGAAPSRLLRISTVDGSTLDLGSLNLTSTFNTGVVDESSQFWIMNTAGTSWVQINLTPGAANFGKTVASGTSAAPSLPVLDWAWVPGTDGDNSLWGLGYNLVGLATNLMKWNRATKTWSTSTLYLNVLPVLVGNTATWASVFASQDGFLYGVDSASGQVFKFTLPSVSGLSLNLLATYVGTTNTGTVLDGARCVKAS